MKWLPSRTGRPSSKRGRWTRLLRNALLILLAIASLPVVVYRFVDPPLTGLMAKRLVQAAFGEAPARLRHDPVSIDEISPELILAVLASEDQGYLQHHGFDWDAIRRAVSHNEHHRRKRGASTISQQTAKNVFLWEGRSWLRKGLEVPYTVAIELLWGKRRILEAYLNCVEFGPGIYGAEAAARWYWHVPASRLSPSQSALLAASLPSPRRSNPGRRTAFLLNRSGQVVAQVPRMDRRSILRSLDISP